MVPALESLGSAIVEDPALADEGARKHAWTQANMPLLEALRREFAAELPLRGRRIGMCLHVEPKTGVLVEVLTAGGAEVVITGSPATTDDGTAAYLARNPAVRIFARKADTLADHYGHIDRIVASDPDLLLDNGADLISAVIGRASHRVVAATEETTTGGNRLREELPGLVPFPVIVINDSPLKLLIENVYGVGPTVVEGFMRVTNCLVASNTFAVIGYGSCGRGIARTLRALGAGVIVVEKSATRALEAAFDGMRVMALQDALSEASVVMTVTGRPDIITAAEHPFLRDGVMLANAGHFGLEIDVPALAGSATGSTEVSPLIDEYALPDGRRIRLLGRGEMLNLTGATGNQIQVMDLGFALQAHSLRALSSAPAEYPDGPQPVPEAINHRIGVDMLQALSLVRFRSQDDYPLA
jgi:adenosylhomocysteinase